MKERILAIIKTVTKLNMAATTERPAQSINNKIRDTGVNIVAKNQLRLRN